MTEYVTYNIDSVEVAVHMTKEQAEKLTADEIKEAAEEALISSCKIGTKHGYVDVHSSLMMSDVQVDDVSDGVDGYRDWLEENG
jgi:hypothetical protein